MSDPDPEPRPTVLVVDDQPNVAEAYALYLEGEYDVRTAEDGEAALEQLDEAVDVVLLDRRMPGLSGDEVLDEIRARGLDCRVAMVTAVDPDFDIVEMPFDAYLTKPVTQDELRTTVERLLTLSEYTGHVRREFAIAEKRAALRSELGDAELEASEEYAALTAQLESLRDESVTMMREMDDDTFRELIEDLDTDRE